MKVLAQALEAPTDANGDGLLDECDAGVIECVGDGSRAPCPCGNSSPSADEAGCLDSTGCGASLRAIGLARLSGDILALHGAGMPDPPVLYFQAAVMHAPIPFGDGLECTGGPLIRLGIRPKVGGSSSYRSTADTPVSIRGMVSQPGTLYYQARYRDAASPARPPRSTTRTPSRSPGRSERRRRAGIERQGRPWG